MRCSTFILAAFAASVAAARNERRQGDAQSSKTLLDSQIQTGIQNNNDGEVEAGQVNSAVSNNNFINFCATKNLPLTNGKQIKTGSCNPTVMGVILGTDRLPAAKFIEPRNLGVVKANQNFTISLKIKNLSTGFFVNPQTKYFGAPSDTNNDGFLLAHSHVAVDKISSIDSVDVGDALNFAFFKGLNGKADENGVLSTVVAGGLDVGDYRVCSINTAANHQPILGSVAQHASFDDCTYFSVTADGTDNGDAPAPPANAANANANTGNGNGDKTEKKGGKGGKKGGKKNGRSVQEAEPGHDRVARLRRRMAHKRRAAELERERRQRRA